MGQEDFKKMIGEVSYVKSKNHIDGFKPAPIKNTQSNQLKQQKKLNAEINVKDQIIKEFVGSEELLSYIKNGYSKKILDKLKLERYLIALEIDLHYLTEPEARKYLLRVLSNFDSPYDAAIKIIHGKSLRAGSSSYPILKNMVVDVLLRHNHVIAYTSCDAFQGGAGATLVLLGRS